MPLKMCPKCGKVIDYANRYCESCSSKYEKQQKEETKIYDKNIRNQENKAFYQSKAWRQKREKILYTFFRIDLYLYYKEGVMVEANTVHHIIPLEDDRSKALDDDNLFPCSAGTNHLLDDGLYKKDKKGTQELLRQYIARAKEEFGIT